jgi:Uma2 family endonuclease
LKPLRPVVTMYNVSTFGDIMTAATHTVLPTVPPADAVAASPACALAEESWVLLENIRWETYEALLEDIGDGHTRVTYDDGRMVIMAPLPLHDRKKKLMGRMIETASIVMNVPIVSMGSSTVKRKDVKKGLEPDEWYYVQNEPFARSRMEFDWMRDPPPDLALEVENTHHPMDRPSIYAALKVNEIWRHDGKRLEFLKRGTDGEYHPIPASEAFPFFTPQDISRHLAMVETIGEFEMIRAFHEWLISLPCERP